MNIVCIFVATIQITMKKVFPNVNRTRKHKEPVVREIIVLMRYNALIGLFTNTLGAVGAINKEVPVGMNVDLPSYSTVNRALRAVGDSYDIATPMGIYTVSKNNLYKFVA
jgi:hypothetical protein